MHLPSAPMNALSGYVLLFLLLLGAPAMAPAQSSPSPLEVDNLFIFGRPGVPEVELLREAGLVVARDTFWHYGQGTASRSVLFENAYLELMWVTIDDELWAADSTLFKRGQALRTGTSPFGIGLRGTSDPDSVPFTTTRYAPEWLAPGTAFLLAATNTDLREPDVAVVPPDLVLRPFFLWEPERRALVDHPLGVRRITGVQVLSPDLPENSPTMRGLEEAGIVQFGHAEGHVLVLELDGGQRGESRDLRPAIPLILRY
jgi:hypothetical protein